MNDNIELVGKLRLDTTDAERQLQTLAKKSAKATPVATQSEQQLKVPDEAMKSLKDLFTGPKGLGNLGKVAKGALRGVSGLASALGSLVPVFSGLATVVAAIVMLLKGTDTMQAIQQSMTTLMDTLRMVLSPALAALGDVLIMLADMARMLLPILEPVGKVIGQALASVGMILKILSPVVALISKLVEVFNSLFSVFNDTLFGIVQSIMYLIIELVDSAIRPLIELLNPLIEFFETIKQQIQDFITTITGGLITFDRAIASTSATRGDYKSSLDTWETTSAGGVPTAGEQLIADKIAEGSATNVGLFAGLRNLMQKIADVFSPIMYTIQDVLQTVLPPLADVIAAVMNVVASVLNALASTFNGIIGVMKSILEAIQAAFGSLTKVINTIKTDINKYVIKPINSVLKGIKNVSIFGAKPFNFINLIQTFQHGGTLDIGAQIWGMNEQGNPEFLFNAGGHTSVINADILEEAMYNAQVRANQAGSKQKMEVSVKPGTPAGPRELVQWILPSLKFSL